MGCDNQVHKIIDALRHYLKILQDLGWFVADAHKANRSVIEASLEVIAEKCGALEVSVYGDGHEYRIYFRIHEEGIMHTKQFRF